MRRVVIPLIGLLNIALLAIAAWQWVDGRGQVRPIHWTPPAAQPPDFSDLLPQLGQASKTGDVAQFLATLDRPLFSPSRRPPPPVVITAPPPPPPPDPLDSIHIYGVFEAQDSGGILARVDGRMTRIRIKDKVGEWSLKSVKDRDVAFVKNSETRILPLVHAKPVAPPPPAVAAAPGAAPVQAPARPATSAAPNPGAMSLPPNPSKQQIEDFNRERLRIRNEIFRQAGLPPITQ